MNTTALAFTPRRPMGAGGNNQENNGENNGENNPGARTEAGATESLTAPPVRVPAGLVHLEPTRTTNRREYRCTFIRAGRAKRADQAPSRWLIPADVLQANVHLFDQRPCYLDHADGWSGPQVKNLVGVTFSPEWDSEHNAITGGLRLYDEAPNSPGALTGALLDQLLADRGAGLEVPPVGLSAVFFHGWIFDEQAGLTTTTDIRHVESVDIVYDAAAGGAIRAALAALQTEPRPHTTQEATMPPDVTIVPQNTPPTESQPQSLPPDLAAIQDRLAAITAQLAQLNVATPRAGAAADPVTTLDSRLASIEATLALQEEASTVVHMGDAIQARLYGGRTGLDQISVALDAMLEGHRPPDGIPPLGGLRDLYMLLSGDWEMAGMFQSDRVQLANVTSATMAALTANALNKRVMIMFQEYPQWWAPIVIEEDFTNLQTVKWITLGGVGELPTVAEGAAYTEMTWDDTYEEDAFVKKGGYLGLTIEAIDKDDTARLRAAPRALAQAAWLTLSKAMAAMFTYSGTGGLGHDLEDSKALFHADHSNYGSTALSWTAWNTTRQLMRDQTEYHSAEPLGALTAPRYLLVPNELEVTALQVLASDGEPGTADNDINPWASGASHDALIASARSRVIVVDFWTDANNWAAVADPRLYPTFGLGYRYGRTPELFSVASPTAGLMFSNDTMPIKVRYFYVLGAIDYRGAYLHAV